MSFTGAYLKKKTKASAVPGAVASLKNRIEDGLAAGAGTTRIKSRDPVFHMTQEFRTTFDLCGQHNASLAAGNNKEQSFEDSIAGEKQDEEQTAPQKEFPEYESTPQEKAEGNFYRRFSETAFNNGWLASAVLQNGGKTMLVSCIKRALGQRGPYNSKQTKLFSSSAVRAAVKNSSDEAVFNRYVSSAVGIVVESISGARGVLEHFENLASEESEKSVPGMKADTLSKVYPFLNSAGDSERAAEYEKRFKELTLLEEKAENSSERKELSEQKAVLNAGIIKTRSLTTKKRQMKEQFLQNLGQLLENARKAEEIFTSQSFVAEVVEELLEMEPPEDDGDGDGKGKNRRKKGKGSGNSES